MNIRAKEKIKAIPVMGPVLRWIYIKYVRLNQHFRIKNELRFEKGRRLAAQEYALIHPDHLDLMRPSSGGKSHTIAKLTALGINQMFPFIQEFLKNHHEFQELPVLKIHEFYNAIGVFPDKTEIENLNQLFRKHGSDKSTWHNYHEIYAAILKNKEQINGLLEVGMGSNNVDVVSNMGSSGSPGASLRAFKDYLPNAIIIGADVDKDILFEEDRIRCYFVDQTKLSTFEPLLEQIPEQLDIIIDDGLHAPNANLAVLDFALKHFKSKASGYILIEDVPKAANPFWQLISFMVKPLGYETYIVETDLKLMIIFKRLKSL